MKRILIALAAVIWTVVFVNVYAFGGSESGILIMNEPNVKTEILNEEIYGGISLFSEIERENKEYEFYSRLDDNCKKIYNLLDENIEKTKNGTEKISCIFNIDEGLGLSFSEAKEKAKSDAINSAFTGIFAYLYDNPQCFWIDMNKLGYTVSYSPSSSYNENSGIFTLQVSVGVYTDYDNYYVDGYGSESEVVIDCERLAKCKDDIMAQTDGKESDFAKVKYFNDWLCDNNTYNNQSLNTKIRYEITSAMIYGPMGEGYEEKYPVCQGYAFAMKYLCDEANIPCTVVTSESHMWNLVKLNEEWYVVDTTWNDNIKDAYEKIGIRDSTLQCYSWLAIGSQRVSDIDEKDSEGYWEHDKSIQAGLDTIDPTEYTLLENMGFNCKYNLSYVSNGTTVTEEHIGYMYLDVNNDCKISRGDIAAILRSLYGNYSVEKDVNGDKNIDLSDAVSLSGLLLK